MQYVFSIMLGYLLGCANLALILAKRKNVNLAAAGSGNPGASNTAMLLGWRAGILVGIHDAGKAFLAVVLAGLLFPEAEHARTVAGVACVLGHIFPFYRKFQGGKGFASYLGMTIGLNWKFALVILAAVVIVTVVTDYIVCGTLTTVFSVPVYIGLTRGWLAALILAVATAVILWKHRENYPRMLNGTEFGLRSALRGENKIR